MISRQYAEVKGIPGQGALQQALFSRLDKQFIASQQISA
jgi:hypothetical protein